MQAAELPSQVEALLRAVNTTNDFENELAARFGDASPAEVGCTCQGSLVALHTGTRADAQPCTTAAAAVCSAILQCVAWQHGRCLHLPQTDLSQAVRPLARQGVSETGCRCWCGCLQYRWQSVLKWARTQPGPCAPAG